MPISTFIEPIPIDRLSILIAAIKARRAPARVVTRGGKAPRGYSRYWKCARAQYQSLLEDDVQRLLEFAPAVTRFETHPFTVELVGRGRPIRYTPDLVACLMGELAVVVEVKPKAKLLREDIQDRINQVAEGFAKEGVPFRLIFDTDVRSVELQKSLKVLRRLRPLPPRNPDQFSNDEWDPSNGDLPSSEALNLWNRARRECQEVLARVMRRDPGDLTKLLAD